jgi:membrane fusion protein (multidrug efflux system)
MKKSMYIFLLTSILVSCISSESNDLDSKKKELEKARKQLSELHKKIRELEREISSVDPEFARSIKKTIPVQVFVAERRPFEHRLEVRGAVESRTNVVISAQIAGEIRQVHVREGQSVQAGQLLISLNTDILQNTLKELEVALELANETYERQARLWQQKVGTEMQYLQAKSNKESLEQRIATTRAQLELAIVRAPFAGTIDDLPARTGQVVTPGTPLVRIVGREQMYVKADVSERFIGKFRAGDPVRIFFPVTGEYVTSTVMAVGQVINPESRTFLLEAALPKTSFPLQPNQVVVLELRDYVNPEAFAVPSRIIQRDEDGHFIFVLDEKDGSTVARKRYVVTGLISGNMIEITEGLNGGELVVDEGYRDVIDGAEVEIIRKDSPAQDKEPGSQG